MAGLNAQAQTWLRDYSRKGRPILLIENPKCVFIHIPKTGGTSIRKGVCQPSPSGSHSLRIVITPTTKRFFYLLRGRLVNFEACVTSPHLLPAAWEKCFKFAFVRNPYDRLVSGWKYFGGEKNFSFANFVQIVTGHKAHRDKLIGREWDQFPQDSIHHHTMPQLHPYNNLKYADFVGRFENLQEDFDKICGRLNIPKQELPHLNKTNHKHYSSYYNKKIKMVVDQYYEEDLQKLGYYFNKEWL